MVKIQVQVMINLKEDYNLSFAELYREAHNLLEVSIKDEIG